MNVRTVLLLALAMLGSARAELAPFVLPWNDGSSGVTDLSAMNRPIDSAAIVEVDAQGNFSVRGERIRFHGVNFVGNSPFMPTNKEDRTRATVTVKTNAASLGFELEVTPKKSAWQLWREQHFTPVELDDAAVSGDLAAPAGDGVVNVLKFAYGLAPKTAARRSDLPFAEFLNVDGQSYLGLSFLRAKAAVDVTLVPETSADLAVWNSNDVTTEVRRVDLGAQERILLRDRTPIAANSRRCLRLKAARIAN